jgi:hypothetical protein
MKIEDPETDFEITFIQVFFKARACAFDFKVAKIVNKTETIFPHTIKALWVPRNAEFVAFK